MTGRITEGRLGGVLQARDTNIAAYEASLDQLAYDLADEVNTIHSAGFGLIDLTANNFFSPLTAVAGAAGNLSLDAAIQSDVNNIAAATNNDGFSGLPGDNTNALAMSDLRTALTMNGGTATFDDFYGSLVADIGNDVQGVSSRLSHQKDMINQLEIRRESISGVSLDEEMADLVRFQYAFEASARLITIADEMLATVLGLAGR